VFTVNPRHDCTNEDQLYHLSRAEHYLLRQRCLSDVLAVECDCRQVKRKVACYYDRGVRVDNLIDDWYRLVEVVISESRILS